MEYSHIGWVPCINGHLDFGRMVPGIQGSFSSNHWDNNPFIDLKVSSINYGYVSQNNHHARRIILQSKVDWKDSETHIGDGKFRVILVAEAPEANDLDDRWLKGKIFLYPLSQEPRHTSGTVSLPWFEHIHAANRLLNEFKKIESSTKKRDVWSTKRTLINLHYDKLLQTLTNGEDYLSKNFISASFKVSPRGMAYLSCDSQLGDYQSYVVLRQLFYYLKYSLHSHKHHYAEEDSLTTIVLYSAGNKKAIALQLLGQLKRELTNIKRTYSNGGSKVYGEEKGIIAYMTSLCSSLKHEEFIDDVLYDREMTYLSALTNSFDVQENKLEKIKSNRKDIKSSSKAMIAIIISFISLGWLFAFRPFFNEIPKEFTTYNLTLLGRISILVATAIGLYWLYFQETNRQIRNKLDSEGLITWINKNYRIKEKEFRKKNIKKVMSALLKCVSLISLVYLLSL